MKIRTTKRCEIEGRIYQKFAVVDLPDKIAMQAVFDHVAAHLDVKLEFKLPKVYIPSGKDITYSKEQTAKARAQYMADVKSIMSMTIYALWNECFDATNTILRLSDRVLCAKKVITQKYMPYVLKEHPKTKNIMPRKVVEVWDSILDELSAKLVDSYVPLGVSRNDKGKKVGERFLFD